MQSRGKVGMLKDGWMDEFGPSILRDRCLPHIHIHTTESAAGHLSPPVLLQLQVATVSLMELLRCKIEMKQTLNDCLCCL